MTTTSVIAEVTEDGKSEDHIWESGFIRKCKLDNDRLKRVHDTWDSAEGLQNYAPGVDKALEAASDDRSRSASWRSSYKGK